LFTVDQYPTAVGVRVRLILKNWKYVPSSPAGFKPAPCAFAPPCSGPHFVDGAGAAATEGVAGQLIDVFFQVGPADGGQCRRQRAGFGLRQQLRADSDGNE